MSKRRHKGDGGLFQRHDHPDCPPIVDGRREPHRCKGRWVGTVDTIIDGDRKRKTVYGHTQREAQAKLKQALLQREAGTLVVNTMTVGKWVPYWVENIAAKELKAQTILGYRSKVKEYIVPRLGHHRLTDLRPEHIRALHKWMREEKGLSESSIRQTHAILRKALRDAMHDGKISNNPADRVKSPSTKTAKREQLTTNQARAALKAAGDDPRWWLALFYGMRQGEVLGLKWGHIDLDKGVMVVEETQQLDLERHLVLGDPKATASIRALPILPQIEVRLRMLWEAQGRPGPDARVFPGSTGKAKQPKRDWRDWRELLATADLPPIALHAARNSASSLLEHAGIPDRLVAQILGHSQVQMTHRYQTADVDRMRQALEGASPLLELE